MAELNFEGDVSQITERQLQYIRSVIQSKGYKNNKVTIEPMSKAGDNYVANVQRITVIDEDRGNFKMVAKIAPQHEIMRMMANTEGLFRNEHIMYTKVLPKFTELEKEADIPPQERLRYALCYGSLSEAPHEVILLEDLNESNFKMLDRMKPISHDCVKSVLKNFALLHSLSFALKHKEPDVFNEYKNSLFDMWSTFHTQEQALDHFRKMEIGASMLLESDVHKKAVNGAITESMKLFPKMASIDSNSKHSVIIQGDAWTNNIMFKFDGETLLESVMIDYQVSKPTSPVTDLLYMIFNCTDYQDRKENFHDWIDYYHCELDKSLSNYGIKSNYVYSRDQLDADLKRYGKTSFGLSVLLAGVLSMNSKEAGEMMESMKSGPEKTLASDDATRMQDPATIALFRKRVAGLVDSYYEFGLL